MVDLCHGPHLPNTGYLKTQAVNNLSRAFWRADVTKDPLQACHRHVPFHVVITLCPELLGWLCAASNACLGRSRLLHDAGHHLCMVVKSIFLGIEHVTTG